MVIMHVLGLSIDSVAKTPIVLLQADREEKVLPIWVGSLEAMNISIALSGQVLTRPSTHDLFHSVLTGLEAYVEGIEIYDFIDGIFHVNMLVRQQDTIHRIDCRPADGIALALKEGAPIVVHRHVLDAAEETEQRQDAIAMQILNPNDEVRNALQSSRIVTRVANNMSVVAPSKLGVINRTSQDHDMLIGAQEKNLAKLLLTLEPMSSRKM